MTQTTCNPPSVPPPAGAELVDRWEGDPQPHPVGSAMSRTRWAAR